MLTFELNNKDEKIEIHADKTGLLAFAKRLTQLANSKPYDHIHLFTEDWGGYDLSNEKQGGRR